MSTEPTSSPFSSRPFSASCTPMTPQAIVDYVSRKVSDLQQLHGEDPAYQPIIADFLKVATQANRLLQTKQEKAATKEATGVRSIRLVRDEESGPPIAQEGE